MQIAKHIPGIVSFSAADREGVEMSHDDALVIEAIIHNFKVQEILMDDGSKINLLPYRVFKAMKLAGEDMVKDQATVKDINGTLVPVEEKIKLLIGPLIYMVPFPIFWSSS